MSWQRLVFLIAALAVAVLAFAAVFASLHPPARP